MTFDNDTYAYLTQFEDNFRTAINSRWSRHPGHQNLRRMGEIYNHVTGTQRNVNTSCQACVLSFLTDIGKLYYADKAEREAAAEKPKKAAPKKKPAEGKSTKK